MYDYSYKMQIKVTVQLHDKQNKLKNAEIIFAHNAKSNSVLNPNEIQNDISTDSEV